MPRRIKGGPTRLKVQRYSCGDFAALGIFAAAKFDGMALLWTPLSFLLAYETILHCYSVRVKKISLKEIMEGTAA